MELKAIWLSKAIWLNKAVWLNKAIWLNKTVWLPAVGLSLLTFTVAPSTAALLRGTTLQNWNPKVTNAAKVTANLLRSKSLHPVLLVRHSRSVNRLGKPAVKFAPPQPLIHYTMQQRLTSMNDGAN